MKQLSRIILAGGILAAGAAVAAGCSNADSGSGLKVGLICLHDKNSTYDKNFIDAFEETIAELGSTVKGKVIKTGVAESMEAYNAAKDLVKQGCNIIFADSFGHESFLLDAAREWPEVTFCHATGTKAKIAGVKNYHNAFASIYEGRYLAGYAAGLKLQDMIENNQLNENNYDGENIRLGYIGAFPYAEVISGYSSWYLGVKAVVPNVVMDVTFTNSWYDFDAEKAGALSLINRGCAIISQLADSMGAPGACEEKGVPNVTYNNPTKDECPNTYLSFSKINWAPYYKAVINAVASGKAIEGEVNNNYTGTLATGSVVYGAANVEYQTEIDKIKDELVAGTRKVFDCSTFTVGGEHVTTYEADVDDHGDYQGETEAIKTEGGITFFAESAERSAPYFDLAIDGITKLNVK